MSQNLWVRICLLCVLCIFGLSPHSFFISASHRDQRDSLLYFTPSKKSFEFMYAGSQTGSAFMSQMNVSRLPGKSWWQHSKTYVSLRLADDDTAQMKTAPHYRKHTVHHSALLSFYEWAVTDRLTTHHSLDKQKNVPVCVPCSAFCTINHWNVMVLLTEVIDHMQ